MATYTVTFDRVGRNHQVEPVTFEDVSDPDELAALIYERVKGKLASRGVEVLVNLLNMTGWIAAGFHNAGNFTIELGADA